MVKEKETEEEQEDSVWNFDQARMEALNFHMDIVETAFEYWNYEVIYSKLITIKLISSGFLKEKDYKEITKTFGKVEELKRELNKDKLEFKYNDKNRTEFYDVAYNWYANLNQLMNKKGLIFRGKTGYSGL